MSHKIRLERRADAPDDVFFTIDTSQAVRSLNVLSTEFYFGAVPETGQTLTLFVCTTPQEAIGELSKAAKTPKRGPGRPRKEE